MKARVITLGKKRMQEVMKEFYQNSYVAETDEKEKKLITDAADQVINYEVEKGNTLEDVALDAVYYYMDQIMEETARQFAIELEETEGNKS